MNEKNWLKNISYVPQSIYMFDESIKYNITLSENENIDEDLFRESLKLADLSDFINSLPKKKIHLLARPV